MKEHPQHKAEAIDALIKSDQMESTARYLTSGRRFAGLETEEIKKRWTQAARTFLISYGGVNPREMDDLVTMTIPHRSGKRDYPPGVAPDHPRGVRPCARASFASRLQRTRQSSAPRL